MNAPDLTTLKKEFRASTPRAEPSFGRSWLGIWLLTWRSHWLPRKWWSLAITVLLVPVLTHFMVTATEPRTFQIIIVEFYLTALLPIYALFTCGGLIRDEVDAQTLPFLLTRSLSRGWLYLFKLSAELLWLEMLAFVGGGLILLVGFNKAVPDLKGFALVFLGTQALAVLSYGGISALLGLISRRYLVLGLIYGLIVEIGIGKIPTNINALSMVRQIRTLLANSTYYTEDTILTAGTQSTPKSILIMILAMLVCAGAGALLVTVREYLQSEEKTSGA